MITENWWEINDINLFLGRLVSSESICSNDWWVFKHFTSLCNAFSRYTVNTVLVMNYFHVMIKIVVVSSGSHMLPSYYGMRRPFIADTEFCSSTKPFSTDVYPSSLMGKSLSCDTGCMSGYSSLIDSYYPESFGDYRSTPFSSGGSTIFSPSALSSLLPSYSSDSSHYLLVRYGTWSKVAQ